MDYLTQRPRLQLLHRLVHCVLNLSQRGFRMRPPPLRQLPRHGLACNLPPRQDLLDLVLAHSIPPAALSADRSVTLPDYAKLSRLPVDLVYDKSGSGNRFVSHECRMSMPADMCDDD